MYRKPKSQIISDAVCGIIMLLSILSYVIVGLIENIWHPTWIIILSAAVLSAVISICVATYNNLQKQREEDKKESENN